MAAFGEFSGSILVSDASVLINFLRIDRMDLIAAVSYEFIATDHVANEISEAYPEQRVRYQAALDRGAVAQVSFMLIEEAVIPPAAFAISCAESPEEVVQQLIKYRPFPALFDDHDKNLHRISGLSTKSYLSGETCLNCCKVTRHNLVSNPTKLFCYSHESLWDSGGLGLVSSVSRLWGTVHIVACWLEVDYMP